MKKFLFLLMVGMWSMVTFAQQDTVFWFAAPYVNSVHGEVSPYRLVVFAFEEEASVTISMPANPNFAPIEVTVPANGYENIVLAENKQDGDTTVTALFNEVTNRGLLVTSTSNVECYYQIDGDNSEAFTLKGGNALGTEFIVVGQKAYNNANEFSNSVFQGATSSVHIVATEDGTEVQIVPSCTMLSNAEDTIVVMLNKGETYAVAAADYQAAENIIGTKIYSSAPIAVTMMDDSVTPNDVNADAIGEQLLSTNFAGTRFVLVSEGEQYDVCVAFALHDNTEIETSDSVYVLNEGDYEVISLAGVDAMSLSATSPIMVFQVVSFPGGGELGGTIVPHIECTGSPIAGYMPFSNTYDIYFNIVTYKSNINDFVINNVPIASSEFHSVDAADEYYYAKIKKPASRTPYVVECHSGYFQMGVSEGNYDLSNTIGFFSDYNRTIPIYIELNGMPIDPVSYVKETDTISLAIYPVYGFNLTDISWRLPDGTVLAGDAVNLGEVTDDLIGTYIVTGTTELCGDMAFSFDIQYEPLAPPTEVVVHDIQSVVQCADARKVELIIDVEGVVDSIALHFPQDTLDSIPSGLFDVMVPMPADGYLSIPYPFVRAGIYDVIVLGYVRGIEVFSKKTSLTFLYPSAVLEQRWNDVICVLANAYNGGYDFTAFQWYKDGIELTGETRSYLSQPLYAGSEYSALLTEKDGTQLMSCPLIAEAREEVTLEPTLVDKQQHLRCRVPVAGTLTLYDLMGNIYYYSSVERGDNSVSAPAVGGIYMAKIVLQTGEEKEVKILVK